MMNNISDVDIEFLKYKTLTKFNHALNQKKFDMFFGYYDDTTNFDVIHSGIGLSSNNASILST